MIDIDWLLLRSTVRQLLPVFGVAFVAALICVPLAAAVGLAVGGTLVDHPRPGEVQRRPISRVGGYGLVAAFFIGLIAGLPILNGAADRFLADGNLVGLDIMLTEYRKWVGLALGAALLLPFAAWDDARRLPPLPQLIAQLGCAAIPIAFGVRLTTISNPLPFGPDPFNLGILVIPATVIWIVGMINTMNWLDTMDGLAGGVALISAAVLVAASLIKRDGLTERQDTVAVLSVALAGSCLGFLVYNFPPARIFMGTSGSMFLGYALGVISIIGGAKIATAVLVLGLPILDTAFVILRRLAAGRSPMQGGDGAHLVHRLLSSGLKVRQITLLVYTVTALFGALSVLFVREQRIIAFAALVIVVGAVIVFAQWNTQRSAKSDAGSTKQA
jgi:UDP-N-acetylmuramyl pentapeptide phosphotransferase/UDP-N-acetylglucosamine-1-phosphate transferase